ncbi:MAG: hypothetical protein HYV02_08535 [Deltaproteobacteria bacterium]|nr:hypothetical protein [Deltaproteobacteria bacterium]
MSRINGRDNSRGPARGGSAGGAGAPSSNSDGAGTAGRVLGLAATLFVVACGADVVVGGDEEDGRLGDGEGADGDIRGDISALADAEPATTPGGQLPDAAAGDAGGDAPSTDVTVGDADGAAAADALADATTQLGLKFCATTNNTCYVENPNEVAFALYLKNIILNAGTDGEATESLVVTDLNTPENGPIKLTYTTNETGKSRPGFANAALTYTYDASLSVIIGLPHWSHQLADGTSVIVALRPNANGPYRVGVEGFDVANDCGYDYVLPCEETVP